MIPTMEATIQAGEQAADMEVSVPMHEPADGGLTEESLTAKIQTTERVLIDSISLEKLRTLRNDAPQDEVAVSNPNGSSQAMAWMAEPEWQGESSEADSEVAGGSREPEMTLD
jgi:hypothetical protein